MISKDGQKNEKFPTKLLVLLRIFIVLHILFGPLISFVRGKLIQLKFGINKKRVRERGLIAKYTGKSLAVSSYSEKIFYVSDLVEDKVFSSILFSEIDSRESDITRDGIQFLKEYYGYDRLARILYYLNDSFPTSSVAENKEWLETLEAYY